MGTPTSKTRLVWIIACLLKVELGLGAGVRNAPAKQTTTDSDSGVCCRPGSSLFGMDWNLDWDRSWCWARRDESDACGTGFLFFRGKTHGASSGRLSHIGRPRRELGVALTMYIRCSLRQHVIPIIGVVVDFTLSRAMHFVVMAAQSMATR